MYPNKTKIECSIPIIYSCKGTDVGGLWPDKSFMVLETDEFQPDNVLAIGE